MFSPPRQIRQNARVLQMISCELSGFRRNNCVPQENPTLVPAKLGNPTPLGGLRPRFVVQRKKKTAPRVPGIFDPLGP